MKDCIEWAKGCTTYGYGQRQWQGKTRYAHRIAYVEANGLGIEDIDGLVVRHKCDNPPCVNPEHLEIGTKADNTRDMIDRGRGVCRPVKGEDHGNALLTTKQVAEIRKRYVPRCRFNGAIALSKEFGVSHKTIRRIIKGTAWKHTLE